MNRRTLGLACAGLALVAVAAGGGGFRTGPAAVFQLGTLIAAALAASLPARPGPPLAGAVGVVLAAVTLLSAALAPYRFASVDRWALWSTALLLAWSVSRLLRAGKDPEEGRATRSSWLLACTIAVLLLQVSGELGFHPGGAPERVSMGSLHGSFASANHLSELLVILVVATLPLTSWSSALGRCHVAVVVVAGVGVALGSSRIAPVALAAALAVWALTRLRLRSLPRPALGLGLLAVGLLLAAAAQVIATRSHEGDAWRRPQIWAAVAPAALERPLLGLGPGSFRHAHHPYNFPVESRVGRLAQQPTTPHGEWLRLPIELGLIGCLLLGLLLVARLRGGGSREVWPLLAALVPVAAVHDFLQAPAIAAWTAVAFILCSERERDEAARAPIVGADSPRRSLALALSAALAAGGLVLRPSLSAAAARSGDLGASLSWNSGQPYRWLRVGDRAAGEGPDPRRLATAMLCYQEAELLAPRLPDPPRQQARALADATRRFRPDAAGRDAAVQAWQRAAARSPHDPFLLVEQAMFLAQTGDPERAWPLAEAALRLEPDFTDAALVALIARRNAGADESEALARAQAALQALPRLRTRVSNDYELELVEPDERLLETAGLRDKPNR